MDLSMIGLVAIFALVLTLPVILSSGSAYLWRKRLSRPWWYWLTATVVLYGAYAISMACFPLIGGISISGADATHPASPVAQIAIRDSFSQQDVDARAGFYRTKSGQAVVTKAPAAMRAFAKQRIAERQAARNAKGSPEAQDALDDAHADTDAAAICEISSENERGRHRREPLTVRGR